MTVIYIILGLLVAFLIGGTVIDYLDKNMKEFATDIVTLIFIGLFSLNIVICEQTLNQLKVLNNKTDTEYVILNVTDSTATYSVDGVEKTVKLK
jgi:hypothetical protein